MSEQQSDQARSAGQLDRDISATRRELAETLDALEYKLDVPARFGDWADDRMVQVRRAWNDNPGAVIGIAAGAVVVVAGIVAGALALPRRGR
ncbi:MAG: DUF3618 domain-containing protein [Microbacteriaceae bacterium]|nr:DUF3618 domain-containing protein [Microbacteriaceae bacterium]